MKVAFQAASVDLWLPGIHRLNDHVDTAIFYCTDVTLIYGAVVVCCFCLFSESLFQGMDDTRKPYWPAVVAGVGAAALFCHRQLMPESKLRNNGGRLVLVLILEVAQVIGWRANFGNDRAHMMFTNVLIPMTITASRQRIKESAALAAVNHLIVLYCATSQRIVSTLSIMAINVLLLTHAYCASLIFNEVVDIQQRRDDLLASLACEQASSVSKPPVLAPRKRSRRIFAGPLPSISENDELKIQAMWQILLELDSSCHEVHKTVSTMEVPLIGALICSCITSVMDTIWSMQISPLFVGPSLVLAFLIGTTTLKARSPPTHALLSEYAVPALGYVCHAYSIITNYVLKVDAQFQDLAHLYLSPLFMGLLCGRSLHEVAIMLFTHMALSIPHNETRDVDCMGGLLQLGILILCFSLPKSRTLSSLASILEESDRAKRQRVEQEESVWKQSHEEAEALEVVRKTGKAGFQKSPHESTLFVPRKGTVMGLGELYNGVFFAHFCPCVPVRVDIGEGRGIKLWMDMTADAFTVVAVNIEFIIDIGMLETGTGALALVEDPARFKEQVTAQSVSRCSIEVPGFGTFSTEWRVHDIQQLEEAVCQLTVEEADHCTPTLSCEASRFRPAKPRSECTSSPSLVCASDFSD